MSENNTNSNRNRRPRGGRNRRGGQQRNNNGNRNRQQGNRGGGNGGSNNRPPRHRRPPKKLTFWQKILKALGLYKDPNDRPSNDKASDSGKATRSGGPVEQSQRPKKARKNSSSSSGERKGNKIPTVVESPRLYVGNLSYDATEYELEELFKGVGDVRNVELVYNRRTHKSKGYGFISMGNVDEAKRAVEVLHDQPFMGRRMIVNGARSNGPADGDSEGRPRRESNNFTEKDDNSSQPVANTDIPENEEVHSLAENKD